ncbi:uncharacterized protein METZ01_LOCUS302537, partial [marine metagenome]
SDRLNISLFVVEQPNIIAVPITDKIILFMINLDKNFVN